MGSVLTAVSAAGLIGLACGTLLAVASAFLRVPADARAEKIREILPGVNCGACGYGGCDDYAEAVAGGRAAAHLCVVGGADAAEKISAVMGLEAVRPEPMKAVVRCSGAGRDAGETGGYAGPRTCAARHALYTPVTGCVSGCIGYGDCVAACAFHAVTLTGGLAAVDPDLCTGCGSCVRACPPGLITLIPKSSHVFVRCGSGSRGPAAGGTCGSGCVGCMLCVKVCPAGAVTVRDRLASIDPARCTNCGACVEACPRKVIRFSGL